jgi:hypothetical protein
MTYSVHILSIFWFCAAHINNSRVICGGHQRQVLYIIYLSAFKKSPEKKCYQIDFLRIASKSKKEDTKFLKAA